MNEHENCEREIAELKHELEIKANLLAYAQEQMKLAREAANQFGVYLQEVKTYSANKDERVAQLKAEVSMLRYQLRAADDRVDVRIVPLERENAELRRERDSLKEHLNINTKCSVYLTPERYWKYNEAESENYKLRKLRNKIQAWIEIQKAGYTDSLSPVVEALERDIEELAR